MWQEQQNNDDNRTNEKEGVDSISHSLISPFNDHVYFLLVQNRFWSGIWTERCTSVYDFPGFIAFLAASPRWYCLAICDVSLSLQNGSVPRRRSENVNLPNPINPIKCNFWRLSNLACVSRKSRGLFRPEKLFLKLRPAYCVKPVFSYVVQGIKVKITARFRTSRRLRFEETKRIMSSEIGPKSFGTFEKQAPGPERISQKFGTIESFGFCHVI